MKSTAYRVLSILILLKICALSTVNAQNPSTPVSGQTNVVTTAVPFLRINPDARAGAMGDLAIATSPDASSSYFNVGKVPFNESRAGLNLTYTPWLRRIVQDVYLASLAGYYKLDEDQALSASLRYFNLGQIQFTDNQGNRLNDFIPREYALDVSYSRKLGEKTGFGVGLKYIYSNLAGGSVGGNTYKPGSTAAGDIGIYHNAQNEAGQGWSFGAALSNLGGKISYTDNADQRDFIPTNLGIGATYTAVMDESNKVMFGVDVNKLMVPTPPALGDSAGIAQYRQKSVVSSWFSSFGDAPGGFGEELREFQVSLGAEYWYQNQFALRAGYFYEDKTKGNRKYFTGGVGLKDNVFGLNFSYLVPTGAGINQNPLANTLRFSLVFDLSGEGNNGGSGQ